MIRKLLIELSFNVEDIVKGLLFDIAPKFPDFCFGERFFMIGSESIADAFLSNLFKKGSSGKEYL
ncbi:hypothetical protein H9W95_09785 [Flavobacterium lindanitolerans]|nr:hypothetical protein [Flavobacterium lindanitolerans]